MLGSSITLSLLSESDKQSTAAPNSIATKRAKTAILTRADHIQHVIAREQPIGINKRKRSFKYSTAQGLSNDTNCVRLNALVT